MARQESKNRSGQQQQMTLPDLKSEDPGEGQATACLCWLLSSPHLCSFTSYQVCIEWPGFMQRSSTPQKRALPKSSCAPRLLTENTNSTPHSQPASPPLNLAENIARRAPSLAWYRSHPIEDSRAPSAQSPGTQECSIVVGHQVRPLVAALLRPTGFLMHVCRAAETMRLHTLMPAI